MFNGMEDEEPKKPCSVLAAQRLRRTGLEVKLDKGFAEGTYCCYVEYDDLAARVGFEAAHRTALTYSALLKKQLGRPANCQVGKTHDGSKSTDPRRRHDLESTFVWFPIETADVRYHDEAVREKFQVAALRAGQAWDQAQARGLDRHQDSMQVKFRQQLVTLLDSPAYAHVDPGTKERLVSDLTPLVFPPRELGR